LSEKTVKNHISRLLGKLGVERRVQAPWPRLGVMAWAASPTSATGAAGASGATGAETKEGRAGWRWRIS
ncbi:LuxR C-terminal-related transcriptional regulator, partial [Streptomyces rhizosphaericola]|uniref:LuxR C-terminal-related transcriptional regulator n=1 Tax=Streptomyces rhizosphaericola TaxID=2564098 RepID=UPI001F1167C7